MLLSLAVILLCGYAMGGIMQKLRLPALLGMMITGIILGPHVLNAVDPSILNLSAELRQIALIVILLRAGLALDLNDLKKVGRPALLMCFVPATFELLATIVLAPLLLGISYLEAAIMGAVLAAVSPAVVVPRMLRLMQEGYGVKKGIPQLIMAGASVDDIFVIVLFTSFTGMYQGEGFALLSLARVPLSIVLGVALGIAAGMLVVWVLKRVQMRPAVQTLVLLGVAFLLVALGEWLEAYVPVSGLLAAMALGATVLKGQGAVAKRMSSQFSQVWVLAELLLFVLVGAAVDIQYVGWAGFGAVGLLLMVLAVRMLGVLLCLVRTSLNRKERIFAAITYLPKATVQAAIGGIPLALNIPAGNLILAVAVMAILITAPLGAIGMDVTYRKLLTKG